jgi:hypothetical protein
VTPEVAVSLMGCLHSPACRTAGHKNRINPIFVVRQIHVVWHKFTDVSGCVNRP